MDHPSSARTSLRARCRTARARTRTQTTTRALPGASRGRPYPFSDDACECVRNTMHCLYFLCVLRLWCVLEVFQGIHTLVFGFIHVLWVPLPRRRHMDLEVACLWESTQVTPYHPTVAFMKEVITFSPQKMKLPFRSHFSVCESGLSSNMCRRDFKRE